MPRHIGGGSARWRRGAGRWAATGSPGLDEVARPPAGRPSPCAASSATTMAAPEMVLPPWPTAVGVRPYPNGRGGGEPVDELVEQAPGGYGGGRRPAAPAHEALLDEVAAWPGSRGAGFSLGPWLSAAGAPTAPAGSSSGSSRAPPPPTDVALLGRLFGTALDYLGLSGGVKADGVGGLRCGFPSAPEGPSPAARLGGGPGRIRRRHRARHGRGRPVGS